MCNNNTYTITANATVNATTISSYVWFKNNVLLANNTNTLTETNPTGIYTYKLVATSAQGCPGDTAVKTITIVSKPTATINATNNCGSKSIAITASAVVVNDVISNHYIIYGDGNTSSINPNNTNHTYANYGVYNLKYVVQSSIGCTADTVYQTIAVRDKPVVNISYNNDGCNNSNFVLTANASVNATSISSYSWFKNGVLLPNNTSTITENNLSGTYTYKLVVSSALGCISDTAVQVVVVENYPTASFTAGNSCVGKTINIVNNSTANNPSVNYLWTTSDGQTSTAVLPNFSFATSGTKTIQLKLSSPTGGCADLYSQTINIDAYPVAAFDITEACIGQNLVILNNSTGVIASYAWQTSNAQQSSSVVPTTFVFNTPGSYSIKLEVATANNCTATLTKTTPIKPPVQLVTRPLVDSNININQPLQLNIIGADTYSWTPFTNLTNANSSNPVFKTTVPGIYRLSIQATTAEGCKASATLTIKVFAAGDYVFMPNAFTPNGDGLNDKFNVTCAGLKSLTFLRVYNRYGQIVFQQNTCNNIGWDGTFKGTKQPGGTYVYNWQGVAFKGKQ
ncbi:MAG: gliding motility-associated C-terminal domain-containing protein [Chitinophagaceae bacterium]|nr:gliding motility-associated C-terminal domain-containing protein [Chitinophagaceae bacterium]